MSKQQIKQLVENSISEEGMVESQIKGVKFFKVTDSIRCAPAVYEPTVIAILNGAKEAVLDGKRYVYDNSKYMCCSVSMPVEAGTPTASPENPLLGVYISLDTKVMSKLALEMENTIGSFRKPTGGPLPQGFALANWDDEFTDALLRLLQLNGDSMASSVLGEGRLRELYYAVLNGEAGESARRAFGVGNEVARAIEFLSTRLDESITIEEMAAQVGMSRAVFHRKFKQATTMSPIQFIKSMRLNTAAMNIVGGMNVNEAASEVGYVSSSQFSREFKRLYGMSPKQWSQPQRVLARAM